MLRHLSALVATVLCACSVLAQTMPPPPSGGVSSAGQAPPVGDNAVFYMFLRYQNSLLQDIQAATDPAAGLARQQTAVQSLGLSVADFNKINPVYQALAAALQAVDTDANAYRDAVASGSKAVDPATIKQFSSRRDQAVSNARAQLQQAVTPAGWQALQNFVEGKFRQSIVRRSVGQ